jgi:glutamate decarboxylase
MPTFNLNFSRPGGQVIAQYYDFIRLGREGYTAVQSAAYEVARRFAAGVAALGPFDLIFDGDPHRGITAVSWRLTPGQEFGYNLYDFGVLLRSHGWLIAAYPLPADREDEVIQRAVIRHGFSQDMADVLLADMRRCLEQLAAHPPGVSLSREEAGSFGHNATPARS